MSEFSQQEVNLIVYRTKQVRASISKVLLERTESTDFTLKKEQDNIIETLKKSIQDSKKTDDSKRLKKIRKVLDPENHEWVLSKTELKALRQIIPNLLSKSTNLQPHHREFIRENVFQFVWTLKPSQKSTIAEEQYLDETFAYHKQQNIGQTLRLNPNLIDYIQDRFEDSENHSKLLEWQLDHSNQYETQPSYDKEWSFKI